LVVCSSGTESGSDEFAVEPRVLLFISDDSLIVL